MPLFRRPDGVLIKKESAVRRFMPYIMPTRNGCAVYHEMLIDVAGAREFLAGINEGRAKADRATLFHLFVWACSQLFFLRPQLDRFVSARRLYQRKRPSVSFSAKKRFADDSPITTVKLNAIEGEPFVDFVARVHDRLGDARSDKKSTVDKELGLALALPDILTRLVVATLRWLDGKNLLPAAMIESDPMYASVFIANLGSIGLSRTYHHLYEWGTISLFAAMGKARPTLVPPDADAGPDAPPQTREIMDVRFTLDERITDGFYSAKSLNMLREMVENPGAADAPVAPDA